MDDECHIYNTENSEQPSLFTAPLQDGPLADSTSDPKKTRGEKGKKTVENA